jgi:hypothetical protein
MAFVAACLVAGLFGAMLFFAAIVAPVTFTALDAANAARHTRAVFPRYYAFLAALAVLAAAAAMLGGRTAEAAALGALALLTLLLWRWLMPRLNRWRDAQLAGDQAAGRRFDLGHRASVALNLAQMVLLLGVLYRLGSA